MGRMSRLNCDVSWARIAADPSVPHVSATMARQCKLFRESFNIIVSGLRCVGDGLRADSCKEVWVKGLSWNRLGSLFCWPFVTAKKHHMLPREAVKFPD